MVNRINMNMTNSGMGIEKEVDDNEQGYIGMIQIPPLLMFFSETPKTLSLGSSYGTYIVDFRNRICTMISK